MELFELKFQGDFGAASDVVLKALKKNPDNKQLEVMSNYLSTTYLYVNSLQKQLEEAKLRIDKLRESSCLLYTSPSPRDRTRSRMPSSA